MGWKDLLQTEDETLVSPWVGGRVLRLNARTWNIQGRLPREFGWFRFRLKNREARIDGPCDPSPEVLGKTYTGYLVGDRFVVDDAPCNPSPEDIARQSEQVHLIELGLDRFARVRVGRMYEDGSLIYANQEMPLGLEDDVNRAFQDGITSVDNIRGVPPALDASFRMAVYQRLEAQRRREELARIAREEEERRVREEERQRIFGQLGSSVGRREAARLDFGEAARSALAVGGAEYLDHHNSTNRGEMIVTFRLSARRFECVCDMNLRIVDAGVCLAGRENDRLFTLESLPGVILEAQALGVLVVFR